jgi:hypothetical protein
VSRAAAAHHLLALEYAQQCLALHARRRTVALLTGLHPREIDQHLRIDEVKMGRLPSSPEWYHSAQLTHKVEASILLVYYRRARDRGFAARDALLAAYRRYLDLIGPEPGIHFDRAFNLVCHLDGLWEVHERSFDLHVCSRCRSRFLVPIGDARPRDDCIFCRFVALYPTNPRLQARFPARPLPDLAAP